MNRIALLLALIALMLVAAGCGESDDDKFVSEVNEICTDGEGDVDSANAPEDLIETLDEYVRKLKEVDPPEEKKDDYDAWVATQEKISSDMRAALRDRDRAALNAVDEDAGDEQAKDLGFDDCAS